MQAQLHTRFTQHDKNIHVFITFADLFSGQMILNAELHKQFCFFFSLDSDNFKNEIHCYT